MQHRDIIAIGAGPAGLTAGYYSSFYGFDTLILEEKIPGGYAAEIPILENYPGYKDLGLDLNAISLNNLLAKVGINGKI